MLKYIILLAGFMFLHPPVSYAQFDIFNKVKDKVEEKVEEKTDEAIDDAVDKGFEGKKNKSEPEDEAEVPDDNENTDSNKKTVTSGPEKPAPTELKSYSKFDFIPGMDLIFYDDFSNDAVGDFPAKWNTNGSGEVVTLNNYPGNWMKLKNAVSYVPYLNLDEFGDDFTIEMEFLLYIPQDVDYGGIYVDFYTSSDIDEVPSSSSGAYAPGIEFDMYPDNDGLSRFNATGFWNEADGNFKSGSLNSTSGKSFLVDQPNRLSFAFNKQRFRVYLNESKVMDLPRVIKPGVKINHVNLRTWYWNDDVDYSILIKDLRIARGLPDNRNQLLTEGKIVSYGILFDSGSDKIKPESYGTLKDIASVLTDNSSVKVKIVGHTDSDGDDSKNLELSKKRAASVKNALSSEFGIDAARLETDGKGESVPVGANDSPEGKAKNRRVELLKM